MPHSLCLLLLLLPDIISDACQDTSLQDPGLFSLPAVLTVYDPRLGGINCDADCGYFASGIPVGSEWYGVAAACDAALLGRSVSFPALSLTVECVDTGGMIQPAYSDYYGRQVLYFDVMWPLEKVNGQVIGAPAWNYLLLESWEVS